MERAKSLYESNQALRREVRARAVSSLVIPARSSSANVEQLKSNLRVLFFSCLRTNLLIE